MTKEWYFCSVACLLLLVELGRLEPIPNFNLHNAIPMEYKNCLGLKQPLGKSPFLFLSSIVIFPRLFEKKSDQPDRK